ncbi:ABC transporter permease [Actinomadura madurae]|uniref:ABC transporter permease n=1 Tax=Actinomadura madurae TaxID=1993 RepID=UPI000D9CD45D|nr:ABC transporter permease [Actinomadura madurae]SPT59966.1 Daunorubicin/doxorubicin resistance ABC transporter permease protein drrB [Actinomadura madurae]
MTTLTQAATDSATMLRRNLRHALRYPSLTLAGMMVPILILLLFVGVFGNALGEGVGGAAKGDYINYVSPGIILMAIASGCMATSVAICMDMTEGIVDRFRTMAISRSSLLTGHVVGSMIQTLISTAGVIAVAVAMGFRTHGGVLDWLAAIGLMLLLTFALTWVAVTLGLLAKNPEGASNSPMIIQFMPFLGSTIVPPESMPAGVRWFAEYQPFTPIIETVRGLLLTTPDGRDVMLSLAWCSGLALAGYVYSKVLFNRKAPR